MASETTIQDALRKVKMLVAMGISEQDAIEAVVKAVTENLVKENEQVKKTAEELHDAQVRIDHYGA